MDLLGEFGKAGGMGLCWTSPSIAAQILGSLFFSPRHSFLFYDSCSLGESLLVTREHVKPELSALRQAVALLALMLPPPVP